MDTLEPVLARWADATGDAPATKALLADTARALVASNVALWTPRGVGVVAIATAYKLYEKQVTLLANAALAVQADGVPFVTEEIFEDARIDPTAEAPALDAKGTGIVAVRCEGGVVMAIFHRCPPLPFIEPGPPIPDETIARLERVAGVAGGLIQRLTT